LVVGLAGCSSNTGSDGPREEAPLGEDDNTTLPDEAVSLENLNRSHTAAVTDAASVTTAFRARLDTDYGAVFFNSTVALNLTTANARQQTLYEGTTGDGLLRTTFANVDSYATPNETYKRTESDFINGTTYNHTVSDSGEAWDSNSVTTYLQTDLLNSADDHVIWTPEGTRQFNDTGTYRFVAEGASEFDGFRESVTALIDSQATAESNEQQNFSIGQDTTLTVTDMNATMLVSPDGVVRYFSYYLNGTIDGEAVSLTVELWNTKVGETTVTEPEWTTRAEQTRDL
jgi:hypothetical protein